MQFMLQEILIAVVAIYSYRLQFLYKMHVG
ncbi:hypothetical protein LINPERHAP1_LOCUS25885 [Linum perenne]